MRVGSAELLKQIVNIRMTVDRGYEACTNLRGILEMGSSTAPVLTKNLTIDLDGLRTCYTNQIEIHVT